MYSKIQLSKKMMNKIGNIKISKDVGLLIKLESSRFKYNFPPTPYCYLLGKKRKKINSMIYLENKLLRGCSQMPTIDGSELLNKGNILLKNNVIPCGLARIGSFNRDSYSRGSSLIDLGTDFPGFFILSHNIINGKTKIELWNPYLLEIENIKFKVERMPNVIKNKGR